LATNEPVVADWPDDRRMTRMRTRTIAFALMAFAGCTVAAEAGRGPTLPPETLRGPAFQLEQYPTPSLATLAQRTAATRFLADLQRAAARWRNPREARRAGFDTDLARRAPSKVGYLHAEHRRYSHDGRYLDPRRPESLIYANVPGRPLVLVGVMFSMPRGLQGRTPGGPITRWHWHSVCARGDQRGLMPRADGSCPPGTIRRAGSEMMHVWFTRDLRSAFAIHAPEPELCRDGLLPAGTCFQLLCDLP
jgi:hypothetical protein